jgi:YHS domain-containing protein
MKARSFLLVLCGAMAVSTTSYAFFQEQSAEEFALKELDPVELVTGREIAGEPTAAATFGKYRYAFSSQDNLATFQKDPARYAVQFGGAEALRNLKTLEVRLKVSQKSGDEVVSFSRISATSFPLTFTRLNDYGDYKGGWTLHPDQGYLSWEHGVPVDESIRQFMLGQYYRLPIHLLKAWQDGEAKAVAAGSETVGDKNADCVRMALHGVTTLIDGKPQENVSVVVESVRVNEPIDAALLAKPL